MAERTIGYKIRNKKTGKYSGGGNSPRWTDKGKVWSSIGHLKNHLHMFNNEYDLRYYTYAEIVTIVIIEDSSVDVIDFIEEMNKEK